MPNEDVSLGIRYRGNEMKLVINILLFSHAIGKRSGRGITTNILIPDASAGCRLLFIHFRSLFQHYCLVTFYIRSFHSIRYAVGISLFSLVIRALAFHTIQL